MPKKAKKKYKIKDDELDAEITLTLRVGVVITQNIPKVVKGNLKVIAKTTFRKKLDFLSREGSL